MALLLADRVQETTTTTGTGTITLAGAVTNFVTFSSVLSNSDTTFYVIVDSINFDWEVGEGTYSSNTLSRDTVKSSSNAGSLVNFGTGTKTVFISLPADIAADILTAVQPADLATVATSGSYNDLANLPTNRLTTSTTFSGDVSGTYNAIVVADDSHNHTIANVDGLQTALDGKQATGNYLTTSTAFGGDVSGTYNAIVVADDSHNHTIANVDGLQTALNGKQPTGNYLTTATSFGGDVSGTYNAIVVADDSHNHTIANVDGLQTALDGKQPSGSYLTANQTITLSGDVTGSGTTAITCTVVNDSHTHDTRYFTETEADARFTSIDHFRAISTRAYTSTTTAALFETEMLADDYFDSYLAAGKASWSYAGNADLTDAGNLTELAGCSFLTWTDNSADNTLGNYTALVIAPNTGGSAYRTMIYNDQGASYSPGWREILTDKTYNSFVPSLTGTGASGTWGINITGNAGTATSATSATSSSTITMFDFRTDSAAYPVLWGTETATTSIYSCTNVRIKSSTAEVQANRFLINNGGTFFSDASGRIATTADFYVQATSNNTYLYSTNTYLGSTSGDSILCRGNTISGNSWSITGAGVFEGVSYGVGSSRRITAVTGQYGTVQCAGSGVSSWEGFSIDGRAVFMHDGSVTLGLYDDVNNHWAVRHVMDASASTTSIYGGNNAVILEANAAGANVTGAITATGNITAYSSDSRLKLNQQPIQNAVDKVMSIGGYTFDWDMDKCEEHGFSPVNQHEHGVLAQEIQAVIPDAVSAAPFDLDSEGVSKSGEDYLSVDYARVVPLLIEAIKEQQVQIEALEAKLAALT